MSLFKKWSVKVRGPCRLQSETRRYEYSNHFDKYKQQHVDWQNWLKTVSEFYKNSHNKELSPLFVKKPFDNRPFIQVKIFEKFFTGLLDSGANSSVLGSQYLKILERFNLRIDKCTEKSVTTADGSSQKVSGCVYLPITIGVVCKVLKVLIVPSLKHRLILGSDFCKSFAIEINFRNNSWAVNCDKTELNLCEMEDNIDNMEQNIEYPRFTLEQQREIDCTVSTFSEISSEHGLGCTNKIFLDIDTGTAKPFKVRQYPMSPFMMNIINAEMDDMLKLGVVEPSHSSWCSPVLLVKKKSGEYRFTFDGRHLNKITKPDAYPFNRVDRILSMLRDAKFISSIDLRKAFWQIPLTPESKEKTAFAIPGRGLFHFNRVPFGLINSAQTQQRLMDAVFGPKYEPKIFVYLDDIIITSSTFEEHIQLLKEVAKILKDANLTVNLEKCEFFKKSLKYLGFVVDEEGLRTDPDKITAMVNYPRPSNTTEIKRFIGMTSWYRRFIPKFSELVSPINDLLKGKVRKKQSVIWSPEAENSFIKLKQALISTPILNAPDFSKPFIIQCDASQTALGSVLMQKINGKESVIAYASRSLSKIERNLSVCQLELSAILFSLEKFRCYVEGQHFTVVTDHSALKWLKNLERPVGKLARWSLQLQQYSFDVIHRKGIYNVVPDALSRSVPISVDTVAISLENVDPFYVNLRKRILATPGNYPSWLVKDDLLYKHVPSKTSMKTNLSEWKLLVPKSQRKEVIKSLHDPPLSSHFGFYKTLGRVLELYYWPKMRRDILKYVRSCKTCASQKLSNTARIGHMGGEKKVEFPWQIIAVDLMGPLPRSPSGFTFLLVVADWYTKYTLLHPIRAATANNVVKFMENNVFLVFGIPQFIIADNGSQFAGKKFKELADKYEVQKIWFNARYHPQANFVERTNKTVGTAIRSYIDEHRNWDKHLPEIQQAINTAKHEVTGYAPAFLNFARYVPMSGKYYGEIQSTEDVNLLPKDRQDFVAEFPSFQEIFLDVKERLNKAYKRNVKSYNLRKRTDVFKEGDKVWRRNKVLSDASIKFSAKLAPKYILCVVRKKISNTIYELSEINSSNVGIWHIKDLKPYFGSNSDVSVG